MTVTRPKTNDGELLGDIQPDRIYRVNLSAEIFGYGPQATYNKIRNGELPTPFPLSASARSEAWTGQQILDHRAAMRELAEAKAKAERERAPQPQPKALQQATKIKKQKLRSPNRKVARATS